MDVQFENIYAGCRVRISTIVPAKIGKEIEMKKYIAEAIGTFALVFFGVGSAVLAGGDIGRTGCGPDGSW